MTSSLDGDDAEVVLGGWLRSHNIGMFSFSTGLCVMPLTPLESLCHAVAGTTDWRQREPAHLHRTEDLCNRCPCRVSLDEHVHAMSREYASVRRTVVLELRNALNSDDTRDIEREFRVAIAKSARVARILEGLGQPVPRDDDLI
jgi:hypothetical protein